MWGIVSNVVFSYWTALLVLVLIWLYRWSTAFYKFFDERGIPYEKPFPLAGNLLSIIRKKENYVDVLERIYLKFKNRR